MRPIRFASVTMTGAVCVLLAGIPAYAGVSPAASRSAAVATSAGFGGHAQPGRHPTAAGLKRTGRLVVGYQHTASSRARAAALGLAGARVQAPIPGLEAGLVSVRGKAGDAALKLLRDPAIRYVEQESSYRAFAESVGAERAEVGVDTLQTAHPTFVGTGVEVAVIDTAVNAANTDLTGRVVNGGEYSQVYDPLDPTDQSCIGHETTFACAHGTAVSGVIAAAANGSGMVGIAPDATIVSYNVFRTNGFASSAAIANAIMAAKNRSVADVAHKLRVINLSLGGSFDSKVVCDAIAAAHAAGIVVVVAAGNDGGERPNFPAGDPFTISVGASEQVSPGLWRVADFSSRGDVDVLAPGTDVLVWYPPHDDSGPPTVTSGDGTSFASPMVAGMAAVLAQQGFTGDVARAAIVAGAEARNGDSPYPAASGAGRADLVTAYDLASGAAPYTAVFLDRGAQVANVVGRRSVEVLRVDPDETVPNTPAALTTSHGTFSGVVNVAPVVTATEALIRTTATYAVPGVSLGLTSGTLTANGGAGGDDTITVPLRFLDPNDGPEGTNTYNGEGAWSTLTYGTRSSYIRSVGLHAGATFKFDFEYADSTFDSSVFAWMPVTNGGVADAAAEPWGYQQFTGIAKGTDGFTLTSSDNPGRWKVGWVTFSPLDDGSYYFRSHFAQPAIAISAPAIVSSSGTGLPFRVSWSDNVSWPTKFDVQWTRRVKSGSSWVTQPWASWQVQTTATTAVFGGGNVPTAVAPGTTYFVRGRVIDNYGNASGWLNKTVVDPFNDNTTGTNWSAGWAVGHSTSRWLGDLHYTSGAGRRLVVVADGQQFQIVGDRCSTCGQFRMYVDGVYRGLADTHAGGLGVRQVLWNSGVLPGGIRLHRIELVTVGTAGRPTVGIDAIGVTR